MKRLSLKVEKRKILGKKVKKLRREGILPANIYGKDIKSQTVQLLLSEFEKVRKEAGETQVVDVALNSTIYPVLIQNIQRNPRTGALLHVDLHKVDLKEKLKAMIPIEANGEAKAVSEKIGLLLQPLSEVEVEALPTDLPEKIEVDITNLTELNHQITVADLKVSPIVAILTDPAQVVFKIGELVTKEAEKMAKAEEEAAVQAAAQAATEKGETPAVAEEATPSTEEAKPAVGEIPSSPQEEK